MADKSLYDVCETLKAQTDQNTKMLSQVNSSVLKMTNLMSSFIDIMAQNRLDMLEAMREKKDDEAKAAGSAGAQKPGGSNIAMILAGIAALAAGFLDGIKESIKALAKLARLDKAFDAIKGALRTLGSGLRTRFLAFVDDAIRIIDDLIKPIKTFFTTEGKFGRFITQLRGRFVTVVDDAFKIFDDLIQPLKGLLSAEGAIGSRVIKFFNVVKAPFMFPFEGVIDEVVKPFKAIFMSGEGPSVLSRIINTITAPFRNAGAFLEELIKPIRTFFSAEGPIAKAFGLIKSAFNIFSEGSQLMTMLGGIGRIIGKLFFPITLIMTAYDTIKGALAGFEDEGIIGAIQGAITGLLNSVIGMPLDLLKSVISWLLSKFGMDEASKVLDQFSFTDLISNLIDGLFDGLKMVINGIIEGLAIVIENLPLVPDSVGDTIRGLKFDTNVQERKKLDEQILAAEDESAKLRKREQIDRKLLRGVENEAAKDGVITPAEQAKIDRRRGKLEKSSAARQANAEEIERLTTERKALEPGATIVDQSTLNTIDASSVNGGDPVQGSAYEPTATGFEPESA